MRCESTRKPLRKGELVITLAYVSATSAAAVQRRALNASRERCSNGSVYPAG